MKTPLVKGMAYVTAEYSGATPRLDTSRSVVSAKANGNYVNIGGTATDSKFRIHLDSKEYYNIYTSSPITMLIEKHRVSALSRFSGTLRIARTGVEGAEDEAIFDQYSGAYPASAELDYSFSGN